MPGDVLPSSWQEVPLGELADISFSPVDKKTRSGEPAVRLCNYVDVYKNDRIDHRINFMQATATPDEIQRFRLERGDVLITKDSEAWDDIGVPALGYRTH